MTYPNSSDVSAGQPTASAHYNNLRKDSLFFGQAPADSKPLGDFLASHAANLTLGYLATNRIRITYTAYHPASIMIGNCMLLATADIDLGAGAFSGAAATWYIHAVRGAGSTSFSLMVGTTPTENATTRVIGTCYWDGSAISSIVSWYGSNAGFPPPGYDSGWFAVTTSTTYTKTHGLGVVPKSYILYHSSNSDGSAENVLVFTVGSSLLKNNIGFDTANAYITTVVGSDGVCWSTRRISGGGYYRLLAWA